MNPGHTCPPISNWVGHGLANNLWVIICGTLALMKQLPPASRLCSSQCLKATSGQSAGLSVHSCLTTGSTFEQGSFKIFKNGMTWVSFPHKNSKLVFFSQITRGGYLEYLIHLTDDLFSQKNRVDQNINPHQTGPNIFSEFFPFTSWTFSSQHSFLVRMYSKSTRIPLHSWTIDPVSNDRWDKIEKLCLSYCPLNRLASSLSSSSLLSASPVVVSTASVDVVDAGVVVGIIAAHSLMSKHVQVTGGVMILVPSSLVMASVVSMSSILWRVRPQNVFWSWFAAVKPENRNVRYWIRIFGKSLRRFSLFAHLYDRPRKKKSMDFLASVRFANWVLLKTFQ